MSRTAECHGRAPCQPGGRRAGSWALSIVEREGVLPVGAGALGASCQRIEGNRLGLAPGALLRPAAP